MNVLVRVKKIVALALIFILMAPNIITASAISTVGYWPDESLATYEWYAYPYSDGSGIYDPADESPDSTDIISVPNIYPSVYIASDGENIYVRMRLRGDPTQGTRFASFFWLMEIAAQDGSGNYVHAATIGLKGGNPSSIYVAPTFGSTLTTVYSNVTTSSSKVRVLPTNDGYSQYFLDFTVPISAINNISGKNGAPVITGDTPVKLYYGTSTNPISIGKDYMSGGTIDFNKLATVKLNDIEDSLAPEMTISKTGPATVIAGESIQYSLTVHNLGPGSATNVVIADAVPSSIDNAEYSLNGGNSWQPWLGTRVLPVFLVSPGVNNILIRGDVKSNVTGTISNTATVTSDSPGTPSATVNTVVTTKADLSVLKEIKSGTVSPSNPIIYGITVHNNGPSDAQSVTITDNINPLVIGSAEYYDISSSTWKSWEGTLNIGTLANGNDYKLSIRGVVASDVVGSITNTAQVSSTVSDPDSANNTHVISTLLNTEADLSLEKTGTAKVTAGEKISYTITVNNNSQINPAKNIEITDYINAQITNPVYSLDGGTSWDSWSNVLNIAQLSAGGSITVMIEGDVLSSASGVITNTAAAHSDTPDPNINNDSDSLDTTVAKKSNIVIEKTLMTPAKDVVAGQVVQYLITYSNVGPSDADHVVITDIIPDGMTNVEASRCRTAYFDWEGSYDAGTVVAGGECTILIRGVIKSDYLGSIVNTASIISDSIELNEESNTSSLSTPVASIADLSLTKTVSATYVKPGGTLVYTITIDNLSTSDALDITVKDVMPSGITYVSADTTLGTWNIPNWHIDRLVAGKTATLTITTTVNASSFASTIQNTASVVSITSDPNTNNNEVTVQTFTSLPATGQNYIPIYILLTLSLATLVTAFVLKKRTIINKE